MSAPSSERRSLSLDGVDIEICLREHGEPAPTLADLPSQLKTRGLARDYLRETPAKTDDRGWIESRLALLEACQAPRLAALSGADLALSLSHSRRASAAAAAPRASIAGLGLDLENAQRPISDAAYARYALESEHGLALVRVELWCVKEACYKADPTNENSVLPLYEVTHYDTNTRQGRARRTDRALALDFCLLSWREHFCAIAIAR